MYIKEDYNPIIPLKKRLLSLKIHWNSIVSFSVLLSGLNIFFSVIYFPTVDLISRNEIQSNKNCFFLDCETSITKTKATSQNWAWLFFPYLWWTWYLNSQEICFLLLKFYAVIERVSANIHPNKIHINLNQMDGIWICIVFCYMALVNWPLLFFNNESHFKHVSIWKLLRMNEVFSLIWIIESNLWNSHRVTELCVS